MPGGTCGTLPGSWIGSGSYRTVHTQASLRMQIRVVSGSETEPTRKKAKAKQWRRMCPALLADLGPAPTAPAGAVDRTAWVHSWIVLTLRRAHVEPEGYSPPHPAARREGQPMLDPRGDSESLDESGVEAGEMGVLRAAEATLATR